MLHFTTKYNVRTVERKRTRNVAILTFLIFSLYSNGQIKSRSNELAQIFKELKLDKKYKISEDLKPVFYEVDLNGDLISDFALFIAEKKTNRKGILVIHGKTHKYYVFGAGRDFGNGGNDFKWADRWSIFREKSAQETVVNNQTGDLLGSKNINLNKPAILIEALEDQTAISGGLIYWNGTQYIWIHQGE